MEGQIHRYVKSGWEVFVQADADVDNLTGKHLLFSEDRELLVDIAFHEVVVEERFVMAKVRTEDARVGPDYVLCLCDIDDSLVPDIEAAYGGMPGIRYRRWKSNEDTRAGRYSRQYLDDLDE